MSSFFSRLFNRNNFELENFNVFAVDMHSHLIPNIDDGSKSLDESILLVKELNDLGFSRIITTPHIMAGGYDNTTEVIRKGAFILNEALKEEGISTHVEAAAEYYMDENFERLIQEEDLLTFGDRYVLFELSYLFEQKGFNEVVFNLNSKDFRPVLAHPERYPYYYGKTTSKFQEIKERGVYFQLNLMSLCGKYGPQARRAAIQLIEDEMIDFVGTDIHHKNQLPELKRVLKEKPIQKLVENEYLLNKKL